MARADLIAALRNALERGEILEEAKASLVNAGYKKEEVEEASQEIEKIKSRLKAIPTRKFPPLPIPSKAG